MKKKASERRDFWKKLVGVYWFCPGFSLAYRKCSHLKFKGKPLRWELTERETNICINIQEVFYIWSHLFFFLNCGTIWRKIFLVGHVLGKKPFLLVFYKLWCQWGGTQSLSKYRKPSLKWKYSKRAGVSKRLFQGHINAFERILKLSTEEKKVLVARCKTA